MKIIRLAIKNYRGVRDLTVEIPSGGAVIQGANAQGKTSILRAIGAALGAQGIGPDAIHVGETSAEIIVDLDALRVRRSITAKGSSVTVKTVDGDTKAKPQTFLSELFGTSSLDPLAFFLADAKERRRQVLEAIPLTITVADVQRWTGFLPDMVVTYDGHGLEELGRLRSQYYAERAAANKVAKDADAKAATAQADAERQKSALEGAPDKGQAEAELAAVVAELQEAKGRAAAAERAHKASAATRQKIESLKTAASRIRADAGTVPTPGQIAAAEKERAEAETDTKDLRRRLHLAEQVEAAATKVCDELVDQLTFFDQQREKAKGMDDQVEALEASLASVDSLAVTPGAIAAIESAVEVAKQNVVRAHAAALADVAQLAAEEAQCEAQEAGTRAADLDKVVDTLTNVAPRELAERADVIPGLAFTDAGITLDGVTLDGLSGAEQLRFAVDLARRANARARILVCDGLERLDPKRMEEFVRYATRDDWQLIGTRVADGELVLEAIEADETPARKAG
jgi:hypothetical protein